MTQESPSLATDAQKVLDEGVELVGRERLPEGSGHDPIWEARYHECARVLDRRGDVLLGRLALLLAVLRGVGGQLVEVRADRAGAAGVGQLVTAPAAVRREQRLAGGRGVGCATAARRRGGARLRGRDLLPQPAVELRLLDYAHRHAHGRVAEAAELGADH